MMPDGGLLARARATGDTARMAEDRTPTGLPCTHAWAVATGGALDLGARRAVTRAALGEAARLPLDLLRARLGRRPDGPMRLPSAPADELVEAALAASAGQGPAHATPGVGLGDSAEGRYLREGAGLELVGLRVADLPAGVVEAVHEAHPSTGLRHAITRAVAAEARANPDGRFAVMTRLGFVPILHARLAGRR